MGGGGSPHHGKMGFSPPFVCSLPIWFDCLSPASPWEPNLSGAFSPSWLLLRDCQLYAVCSRTSLFSSLQPQVWYWLQSTISFCFKLVQAKLFKNSYLDFGFDIKWEKKSFVLFWFFFFFKSRQTCLLTARDMICIWDMCRQAVSM